MTILRAQVERDMDSALPEDRVINTFHFNAAGAGDFPTDDIDTFLTNFYTVATTTGSIAEVTPESMSGTWRIKIYNLADAEPRVPVVVFEKTPFTPGGGNPLPHEVALCLSYHAAPLSGSAPARRRGRLYIGPIGVGRNDTAGRPNAAVRSILAEAGERLAEEDDTNVRWCVYSPTALPVVLAGSTAPPVVGGWVDNAWDTQRRRGPAATARTTWTAT